MPALNLDVRITLVFAWRQQGWTESHILQGQSFDLSTYENAFYALAQARGKCLGNQGSIPYLRWGILQPGVKPSLNRVIPLSAASGKALIVGTAGDGDAPDTAALIRMRDIGAGRKKFFYLRGMSDSVTTGGGQFIPVTLPPGDPAPVLIQNIQDYIALLGNGLGSVGPLGWIGSNVVTKQNVLSVVADPTDGTLLITFAGNLFPGPFGLDRKTTCRFSGMGKRNPLNKGVQIVHPLTATTCRTARPTGFVPYVSGGAGVVNTTGFLQYGNGVVFRIVERKAGRPLYQSAGKAKG